MDCKIRNLLTETLAFMEKNSKAPTDIIFIGNEETGERCTWEEFKIMADKDYIEDYGYQKVRDDLIIIFSDYSRIYRYVYDNLGEWKFIKRFEISDKKSKIKTLFLLKEEDLPLDFATIHRRAWGR